MVIKSSKIFPKKNGSPSKTRSPHTGQSETTRTQSLPVTPPKNWHPFDPLFPSLNKDIRKILEILPKALDQVWPLNEAHRKSLPKDIGRLSEQLTCDRSGLNHPYWSSPANISAYLYYFLPWNIIRLARLFSGLPLPAPVQQGANPPLLLDAGSGPLSAPIALWLARPQWRTLPLHILALDIAKHPMEIGRKLFHSLCAMLNLRPWPVHIASGPMETLARHYKNMPVSVAPWLVTSANVLNEIMEKQSGKMRKNSRDEEAGGNSFGELLQTWMPVWNDARQPLMLFVEPGTRLGGTTIMKMRKAALELNLIPLAPCTHDQPCPLLEQRPNRSRFGQAWCHFTFLNFDAPKWLLELSAQARLHKKSLSLSPLLLSNLPPQTYKQGLAVRTLSQPFNVDNLYGEARYACSCQGLGLLENARNVDSGTIVMARNKKEGLVDAKSGARILSPV